MEGHTNQTVRQLYVELGSDAQVAEKLMEDNPQQVNLDSLRWKIRQVNTKIKKMKKSKKLDQFLAERFELPKVKREIVHPDVAVVMSENSTLKKLCTETTKERDKIQNELTALQMKYDISVSVLENIQVRHKQVLEGEQRVDVMKNEVKDWERKFTKQTEVVNRMAQQLMYAQEKMSKFTVRNVNKRENRAKLKIQELKDDSAKQSEEIVHLKVQIEDKESESMLETRECETTCEKLKSQVGELKAEKHNLQKQVSQLKRRRSDRSKKSDLLIVANEHEIDKLQCRIKEDGYKIKQLQILNEVMESDTVVTFEGGKYISEMRSVIMTLITECNVSINRVNSVINTVLQKLAGTIPSHLPSHGVLCRILAEAKFIAQSQVCDAILTNSDIMNDKGVCLHSDGTTKFHREYESFQVTLPDGQTMSIGMSEVSSQTADSVFNSFRQTLSECAQAMSSSDTESQKKTAKLVSAIQTTMTDQGPSNNNFFKLLSELRADLLPTVFEEWEGFDDETKTRLGSMANFFCKLHLLANFCTESGKVLQQFEKIVVAEGSTNPFAFASEPVGAMRCCKNASKALTPRGSDRFGVGGHWKSFMVDEDKTSYLINVEHDRLNTMFYQGAAVFHHRNDITRFLSQWPDPNELLKCLLFDIQEPLYLAECRALGIVDKLITGPFWRLIEQTPSVLSLNSDLAKLQAKLDQWSKDATPLLDGSEAIFENVVIHRDALFESLFHDEEGSIQMDTFTKMALEMICHGLLLILERQAKDQLPEGKYSQPNEHLCSLTAHLKGTNIVSERDFAQLDWLLRIKPAGTVLCHEAIILWTNNKTSAWLDSLDPERKEELLDEARRRGGEVHAKFKQKQKQIMEDKIAKLHEKQKQKEAKNEKKVQVKVKATTGIMKYGGLWLENTDVDLQLGRFGDTERHIAVWAQICFHRDVLKSAGKRTLFQKTVKGKSYTFDEMVSNLKEIILLNNLESGDLPEENVKLNYCNTDELDEALENNKSLLFKKIQEGRFKRAAQAQKEQLPKYLASPTDLVHKRVKHNCRVPGEAAAWFLGTVVQVTKGHQNPMKIKYRMKYDEEEDEYDFTLLQDMAKGDLIVI